MEVSNPNSNFAIHGVLLKIPTTIINLRKFWNGQTPIQSPQGKNRSLGWKAMGRRGKNHMITIESSLGKIGNKVTMAKGFSD
jgi:hypothetical protein